MKINSILLLSFLFNPLAYSENSPAPTSDQVEKELFNRIVNLEPKDERVGRPNTSGIAIVLEGGEKVQIFIDGMHNNAPSIFYGGKMIPLQPTFAKIMAKKYSSLDPKTIADEKGKELMNKAIQYANSLDDKDKDIPLIGESPKAEPKPESGTTNQAKDETQSGAHEGQEKKEERNKDQETVFEKWKREFKSDKATAETKENLKNFIEKFGMENNKDMAAVFQKCVSKTEQNKPFNSTIFFMNNKKEDKDRLAISIAKGHSDTDTLGNLTKGAVKKAKKSAAILKESDERPEDGLLGEKSGWELGSESDKYFVKKLKEKDSKGKEQYLIKAEIKGKTYFCKKTEEIKVTDPGKLQGPELIDPRKGKEGMGEKKEEKPTPSDSQKDTSGFLDSIGKMFSGSKPQKEGLKVESNKEEKNSKANSQDEATKEIMNSWFIKGPNAKVEPKQPEKKSVNEDSQHFNIPQGKGEVSEFSSVFDSAEKNGEAKIKGFSIHYDPKKKTFQLCKDGVDGFCEMPNTKEEVAKKLKELLNLTQEIPDAKGKMILLPPEKLIKKVEPQKAKIIFSNRDKTYYIDGENVNKDGVSVVAELRKQTSDEDWAWDGYQSEDPEGPFFAISRNTRTGEKKYLNVIVDKTGKRIQ